MKSRVCRPIVGKSGGGKFRLADQAEICLRRQHQQRTPTSLYLA
jgi:hypothetical protein